VNIRDAGLDVLPELKLLAALGNLDRPQFAGSVIDILKQMTMDGAQVLHIEIARRHTFADALGNEFALVIVQARLVTKPEFVFENIRTRIDVRIAAHSAARALALPRI